MGHITVAGLSYSHPGGELLFSDVSFKVGDQRKAVLVGNNGVGKTTLVRLLAGELTPEDGVITIDGKLGYMRQDVGVGGDDQTVRELLLGASASRVRDVGERLLAAERAAAGGGTDEAIALSEVIGEWSEIGGYAEEAMWDSVLRDVVRRGLDVLEHEAASTLSGGERKQVVLRLLFGSDADVLLLDEPDNFLDVPAKHWLEAQIAASRKTVLMISHDRRLLADCSDAVVTLESSGAWMHGESYATYSDAREARQRLLGNALERWNEEERRLFQYYKLMKQRASFSPDMAARADAAESRWKRYVDAGPPPAPAEDQNIIVSLRGSATGQRVAMLERLELVDLTFPFSVEIFAGEHIGLVGPNGSGKSHLLRLIAGEDVDHTGDFRLGARVQPGLFTQTNDRPEFVGRKAIDPVVDRCGNHQAAMSALGRYGLSGASDLPYDALSGGQKARLEILCLELDGCNLLLLDEPTDNLDVDSADALERALAGFEGTVIAVSHDRMFLANLERFVMVGHDGEVHELPDWDTAHEAIVAPDAVGKLRLSRRLTRY